MIDNLPEAVVVTLSRFREQFSSFPGAHPESVQNLNEIFKSMSVCDSQEECRRILFQNGMQEALTAMKVGEFTATFATVRAKGDWYGLIFGLMRPEDKELTFVGMAIPPDKELFVRPFFCAVIWVISDALRSGSIEVRSPSSPENN